MREREEHGARDVSGGLKLASELRTDARDTSSKEDHVCVTIDDKGEKGTDAAKEGGSGAAEDKSEEKFWGQTFLEMIEPSAETQAHKGGIRIFGPCH